MLTYVRKGRSLALALALALVSCAPAFAQTPSSTPPFVQRQTFSAAAAFNPPLSGAGDVSCIYGSATRLIRVKRVSITGIDATAQSATVQLIKRSTAATGGTGTSPTTVSHDSSNNITPTATVTNYTVVPTSGTAVGTVRVQSLGFGASTGALVDQQIWDFNPQFYQQEVVLRGVAQGLCVNFPNAFTTAPPAPLNVEWTWTEN